MLHAINSALIDGETLAVPAGAVTVAVQCVRLHESYRLSIRYGSTGAEVPELSKSYPSEMQARRAARMAVTLFRSGWSVQQMLDAIATFTPAA